MANRIVGSTDTTGAISVRPRTEKSVLIVCENTSSADGKAEAEKVYSIVGTADAEAKFGETVSKLVRVLINNGADNIKCISIGSYGSDDEVYKTIEEAYKGAMHKSLSDTSIKCIILDSTEQTVITALKEHVGVAEDEDVFRYGIVGATSNTISDAVAEANAINDKRIFMPFPHFVDASNTAYTGIYGAAGLAALIMTETSDPALPMNGVEFVGFGGINMTLLKADKNTLEQGGITAIVDNGTPSVWRLVTTRTKDSDGKADIVWHEGSTVFIADNILDTMITTLHTNFKRTKNTTRILDAIKTAVIGVLEEKEGLEIIENFDKNTVSVVQDPDDIYGALVDYEFDVVTPLYTITITQHMKL